MHRRSFVARALAAFPALPILVSAGAWGRGKFSDVTTVTVSSGGDKPVAITVVGAILGPTSATKLETFAKDKPLRATTPFTFRCDIAQGPVVISAEGKATIRVVADRAQSNQHLLGRARSLTLRKLRVTDVVHPDQIELIVEGKPPA